MNDRYHLLSFNDEGRARAGLLVGERVYPYGPQLGELLQPRLRHFRHAHVRRRSSRLPFDMRLRQNPEQRRLSDLRQSNNSRLHKPEIVAHPPPPPGPAERRTKLRLALKS